jgi:hypothetical protein
VPCTDWRCQGKWPSHSAYSLSLSLPCKWKQMLLPVAFGHGCTRLSGRRAEPPQETQVRLPVKARHSPPRPRPVMFSFPESRAQIDAASACRYPGLIFSARQQFQLLTERIEHAGFASFSGGQTRSESERLPRALFILQKQEAP